MSGTDSSPVPPGLRWLPGALLVAFALGSLLYGITREVERSRGGEGAAPAPAESPCAAVTLTYFHGEERCRTCRAIEARIERYVRTRGEKDVAAGRLRYRVINFDEPRHRALRERYDLASGGVVVEAPGPDGRWENLFDVWILVDDESDAFESYVTETVEPYLEALR